MKYIIFEKRMKTLTICHPIIFPNNLVHADIAQYLIIGPLNGFKPIRAGEVTFMNGIAVCFGKSETLGLSSDPVRDSHIINMNDYGGGLS